MKSLIALLTAGGGGFLLRSTTTVAFAFQAASCVDRTSSLFRLHSSTNAVVSVGEDAARDVESMNMWATNMGIQRCDGCELTATYEEDGFGGVAEDWSFVSSQTIAAGSPVLFVPSDVILSSGIVRNELYAFLSTAEASLADQGMEKDIPLFALFVKVLAEYERGTDSPFYYWLNSLPRKFNNGAAMTYSCFECLLPYAAKLAESERDLFSKFRETLDYVLVTGFIEKKTRSNMNVLKWAFNAVATRSFIVYEGEWMIIPMADYFNHATEPEVTIDHDEDGNVVFYAAKDIPAGYPIRVKYPGPSDPSALLAKYGFLDEQAPGTFCKMMNLQNEMSDLGLTASNMLFYSNGEIAPEIYDCVLYSILGGFDQILQQQFYDAYTSGDEATKQNFHNQYWEYTAQALREHVDQTLQDLYDLSVRATNKDVVTHPRLPVILKHNEFVTNAFYSVRESLNPPEDTQSLG
ncbi:hypothetical protein ACHAWC_005576 [Mediolabrus comicus]